MCKKRGEKAYGYDCSAKFYPIMSTSRAQSLFHLSATLKDEVDGDRLCRALNDALGRFATFRVKQIRGYSEYKLVNNDAPAKVFPFDGRILAPIDKKLTGGYLFRLSYRGREARLDMFHGLADGAGAMKFFLAILRRYRELEGVAFDEDCGIISVNSAPCEQEGEDAFLRYAKKIKLSEVDLKDMAGSAPHLRKGTPLKGGYEGRTEVYDCDELTAEAKKRGVSFTAFMTGLLAMCIERESRGKRPFVLMIPVNLRRFFPSETLRNFVLFTRVVIHPEKYACLDDYVAEAAAQLGENVTKEKLLDKISTTAKGMTAGIMRATPLFIKIFFARIGRLIMRSRQTIIYSNLGVQTLPEQLGAEALTFNLNVSKNNVQNFATLTYRGKAYCSVTSAIKERALEDEILKALGELGIMPKTALYAPDIANKPANADK